MLINSVFPMGNCDTMSDPYYFSSFSATECFPGGNGEPPSYSHVLMRKSNRKSGQISFTDLKLGYSDTECINAVSPVSVEHHPVEYMDECIYADGRDNILTVVDRSDLFSFNPIQTPGAKGVLYREYQSSKGCLNQKTKETVYTMYLRGGFCSPKDGAFIKTSCDQSGAAVISFFSDSSCNTAAGTPMVFSTTSAEQTCNGIDVSRVDCLYGPSGP